MDVLAKADLEISRGRLWRAKEILHRAVGHSGYRSDVYEKLGNVLLQMSDLVEAGKYLFLAGSRNPEYADAIDTFVERYREKPQNIFHPFPKSAKLSKISEYPPAVADELRQLGLPEDLEDLDGIYVRPPRTLSDRLLPFGCIAIALLGVGLVVLGVIKLVELLAL
jgi:hypothetical protein